MIKRTLYFGNPAYLSLRLGQIVVKMPGRQAEDSSKSEETVRTVPIEDVGVVVLDNRQITTTQGLLEMLLENNCAVITCDSRHLPVGLMLPLAGNTVQNERFRSQIDASLPLKKQLWQQTVQAKIRNQAALLEYVTGESARNMLVWSESVRSGDSENMEARAAAFYWKNVFPQEPDFLRDQDGEVGINVLLNYGYAILRAVVARSLVSCGLLPTLGIHHHNRYNAYCLADDIMEPYRPYVDRLVFDMTKEEEIAELTSSHKARLLGLPVIEVEIGGRRSPLMNAVFQTTSSLVKCFNGEIKKLSYPDM